MTVRVLTIAPVLGCLTFAVAASPSRAALVISTAPTQNVTCTAGDCRPTATDATLDVADLQSYLAAGDVSIKTAGAGGQETGSIQIDAPFSWRTRSRLVLQAGTSITVTRKISVDGQGSLTVDFNGAGIKGAGAGRLSFGEHGRIRFRKPPSESNLLINGEHYKLVAALAQMAAVAATLAPGHGIALMDDIDASADGNYPASPVSAVGDVEGLGNRISGLSIIEAASDPSATLGLFGTAGSVSNLRLLHVNILASYHDGRTVGGIAGDSDGRSSGDEVSGDVRARGMIAGGLFGKIARSGNNLPYYGITASTSYALVDGSVAGGMVGIDDGATIVTSAATGRVRADRKGIAGGLAGEIFGRGGAVQSFATGSVRVDGPNAQAGGGLVGLLAGSDKYYASIENCYAHSAYLSASSGAKSAVLGGLVGSEAGALVENSYSAGPGEGGLVLGGFAGTVVQSLNSSVDWDSSTYSGSNGVGDGSEKGVHALTDTQLRSALPKGFTKDIWAQSAGVNRGYPYLIKNPPQ